MFDCPILFIIFNRPETEKRVFDQIRKIKPKYLYVAADGPRKDRLDDVENCKAARKIVDENVDWNCDVKKLYRKENLGCKLAVSGAIDWFFENVDEGIILEDDCLPNLSFFKYCEELLKRYKNDERIMHISGDNFLRGTIDIKDDYYFSRFNHVWGWATWRRAWKKYDVNMSSYPEYKDNNGLKNIWKEYGIRRYWRILFDKTYKNKIDTWDYQWTYAIWKNMGLSICPKVNLIQNIGFGGSGTHTTQGNSLLSQITNDIYIKKHPVQYVWNNKADYYVFDVVFDASLFDKVKYFFKNLF